MSFPAEQSPPSWPRWGTDSCLSSHLSRSPWACKVPSVSLPSLLLESQTQQAAGVGREGPERSSLPLQVPKADVITCQEKAPISRNSSLPELPTHSCSRPSSFQMFLTRMQSRCLGARQTDWGQDKEPPSSGTSSGFVHLTQPTSSASGRKDRTQLCGTTPEQASLPGVSSRMRRIKRPCFK